jgi:hypothetical protein
MSAGPVAAAVAAMSNSAVVNPCENMTDTVWNGTSCVIGPQMNMMLQAMNTIFNHWVIISTIVGIVIFVILFMDSLKKKKRRRK